MEEKTSWTMPKWSLFLLFLKSGLYRGKSNFKLKRILCWYGRHKFVQIDFPTNLRLDCVDCGEQIVSNKK